MKPDTARLLELIPRYDQAGPRYTSYPTAPVWKSDIGPAEARQALARVGESLEHDSEAPLSLYVHVPFCERLCHFCACNRVVTRKPEPPIRFLETLDLEVAAVSDAIGARGALAQLHLGGGTPTHLTPDQLRHLYGAVRRRFDVRDDAEISIEVDPRVTTDEHLAALVEAGVNRLSLGVQDFDARVQEAIHRVQSVEQVERLCDWAAEHAAGGVNFDLIYGLPFQTEESFARTLEEVIRLSPDRIALYSYAHVTWVARQQRGFERIDLPSADAKMRIMLMAISRLIDSGYEWIGMDHFVLPDDELARAARERTLHRNFMGYTTRPSPNLVALGPSGISELEHAYLQSARELADWHARVAADGLACFRGHLLSEDDRERAHVIHRIMCDMGVDAKEYRARFGVDFASRFASELALLDPMEADGLIVRGEGGGFRVTADGQLLLRNIAMAFDAYLPAQRAGESPLFSRTI